MNSIEKQLNRILKAALINDGQTFAWILYTLLLVSILVGVTLESIFYFSSSIRFGTWQLGFILLCLFILSAIVFILFAFYNRINRYRKSTLARAAGRLAFPKEDTIINALQLERGLKSSTSRELSKSFVDETLRKFVKIDESELFSSGRGAKWKRGSLVMLVIGALVFSFNLENSAQAIYRWFHPRTEFSIPKPFVIRSETGNINLLGSESAELSFSVLGDAPDSLFIDFQSYTERDSLKPIPVAKKDSIGVYHYTLEDISQNHTYRSYVPAAHFWEAWEEVTSETYTISVTDRPVMEDLTITVIAPDYAKIDPIVQKGNQANISGLFGSSIQVKLRSNRPLKEGNLILDDSIIPMKITGKRAAGEFPLEKDSQLSIQLLDIRGISNRNPIPFQITVIEDFFPDITVLQPERSFELGRDQSVLLQVHIEDDFGFSNLQVAYEIHRPAYIAIEPLLSLFTIPIDDPRNVSQDIFHSWQLGEFGLMPEDEIHFHFELSDNDEISGPKKTVTEDFIARLPGLAELFLSFEQDETDILNEIFETQEELESIRKNMDQLELDVLKQDQLTWDQQQDLQKMLEGIREEIQKMEKLNETIDALQEAAEKHDLFSSDLMEKFSRLQQLVDEILSNDLMQNLLDLEMLMSEMDINKLQEALASITDNIDQIEQQLDRFIDIFERIMAEQKIDELRTRIESLAEQQENIHERIERTQESNDSSNFPRLSEEQQRQVEEFSNIRNKMDEAAEAVEKFHPETSDLLKDLKRDPLMNQTYSDLQRTVNQLRRQNVDEAVNYSSSSLEDLQKLLSEIENIQQGFQSATTQEMAAKFQRTMRDVLTLSKSQEQLQNETSNLARNSPRLGDLASRQLMIQDQLRQVMEQLMNLSRETFAVTPEMGRAVGMANAMMEEAKNALAQRNGRGAAQHQQAAMSSLNEAALAIHQSMNQMRSSGSAGGFEQFLEQMQKMAGQQQGINSQSMQLALGQMAAAGQKGLLQQLLQAQRQVRKSLQELINEAKRSGEKGLGDMGGIAQDMDDVLNDFQRKRVTHKTIDRQRRILSRMLDSQKSLTQRGEKEKRKSETGTEIFTTGPDGLPLDMGQRRNLALDALDRALKAGYPRDYQIMIRRYFNSIIENQPFLSKGDSTVAN
ncbi:MAG: hypothetical protein IIB95_01640 [Candidatus Marinimicrobia bacterium]|nr:hypothetical protein [Candidatus Neomarinimicrobiota bacterium]